MQTTFLLSGLDKLCPQHRRSVVCSASLRQASASSTPSIRQACNKGSLTEIERRSATFLVLLLAQI